MKGEFYTVREMAEILNITLPAVKARLQSANIIALKNMGNVSIYAPDALEQIRVVKAKGWQKKRGATDEGEI
jgi:hypothetical protein